MTHNVDAFSDEVRDGTILAFTWVDKQIDNNDKSFYVNLNDDVRP